MYQPDVHIGIVKYIDRGKDFIPEGNSFYPFFHKGRSLEHENELRAIIQELPSQELPYGEYVEGWIQIEFDLLEQGVSDNGVYIPVDLDVLIERVIVSPTAPEWFGELVEALANKYDLKKDVKPSSLDDDPVF